jgi:serine/threonine protein kinase
MPSSIPEKIGPYKVESLLQKGGMDLLYLGLDTETKTPLAIKVLSAKNFSNPEMSERFLKEAQIIERANHPNIVKLYGHGHWEGGLYIAMEFIQGISLRKLILQKVLSFHRSLEIILEIAYAIEHLHQHGVIHRDLKPENIMLSEEGGIKVIDFGVAMVAGDTLKKKLVGTPTYMSPEQKENPLFVTYSTDIYSLAIITYELCIGKLSYGVLELSKLPKGLRTILNQALKSDPFARTPSISDFIAQIKDYLKSTFSEGEEFFDLSLNELSDLYESVSLSLKPPMPLLQNKLQLSLSKPQGLFSAHMYIDTFMLKEEEMLLVNAWPQDVSVRGMFSSALLKGMLLSLLKGNLDFHLVDFVRQLNSLVYENELLITLSFLKLSFKKDQIQYLSCDQGGLFSLNSNPEMVREYHAQNPKLGALKEPHLLDTTLNWNIGDSHLLVTSQNPSLELKKKVQENPLEIGQKKADATFGLLYPKKGIVKVDNSLVVNVLKRT